MQEMWVGSLGLEDSLQEGMVTHSSTLAWRIPWTEEPRGLQSIGHAELDTTEETEHAHLYDKDVIKSPQNMGFTGLPGSEW